MLTLILSAQLLPVQGGRSGRDGRQLGQGSAGIDVEIAIVRMLLAEVVARLRFGLSSGEDLLQLLDEFLQILTSKFPAEPKYQAWYAAHGGESLGNLAGSLNKVLRRETSPLSSFPIKSEPASLALSCEYPESTLTPLSAGGESRYRCSTQKIQRVVSLNTGSF